MSKQSTTEKNPSKGVSLPPDIVRQVEKLNSADPKCFNWSAYLRGLVERDLARRSRKAKETMATA